VGTRFSARPDRPWGSPSLLYNRYRVFLGDRGGRGVGLTPHPHLECRVPRKSSAIPLLTLRAFVAYKKGENLPYISLLQHPFKLPAGLLFDFLLCEIPTASLNIWCQRLLKHAKVLPSYLEESSPPPPQKKTALRPE